ncbi:right-handed parallel beta-helix repeat-containing protein [Jeotgalibacillus marinus]|uniref:Right-handed parallel beta-helix repeat-containing protein n=1 Tax=Jeotgalibacillus marinus TaxID=86667 RepID=A0ABV3Q7A6_9BACL
MKTSKDKGSVPALLLTFVGILFIGIIIVAGILIFNEKTLVVPDEFPTISAAVTDAKPGDIILVKTKEDGTPYEENVVIDEDNIKLIGIGKEKPVLEGDFILSTGRGIDLTDRSGVLVQNFIIQKFNEEGFFLSNSDNVIIKENIVKENGGGVLVGGGIVLGNSNKNMMKGNTVQDNENDGIFLNGSGSNMMKGNIVNGNGNGDGEHGIELISSNDNIMKGNIVNDNNSNGIDLSNSESNMMKGNTVNGNFLNGINLSNSASNMMKGNTVNNSEADGIQLFQSSRNIIKGNTVNDNGVDGISLNAASNENDVFFNRAFGNGLDIRDLDANNFKGNKCDTSNQPNICN